MRILVIDDYLPHAESLVDLLSTRGHDALHAESYDGAQWLLDVIRFDLAFLDFDMRGETGTAVAGKLAERFPALRSVIVSARIGEAIRDARGRPGLLFIPKPVFIEPVVECLDQVERDRRH